MKKILLLLSILTIVLLVAGCQEADMTDEEIDDQLAELSDEDMSKIAQMDENKRVGPDPDTFDF